MTMPPPALSVVVPTLNRADTLRFTLETLVEQECGDCEFVIQNNGNNTEIKNLVESFRDPRLKHFSSDEVLPMRVNWEAALSNSCGNAILFIGDDDGLMPGACQIARSVFEKYDNDILSWSPFWYFWPAYFDSEFRGRLLATINCDVYAENIISHDELMRLYNYDTTYDRLPMIYNSFVRRRVIDRVREQNGQYFVGLSPDVTSGILNARFTNKFLRISRPLSVTGTSHHSTGHRTNYLNDSHVKHFIMQRDFERIDCDSELPEVNLLAVNLARELIFMQKTFFPDDKLIVFNFEGLIRAISSSVNDNPDLYDESLGAIQYLGRSHGVDVSNIEIPPRKDKRLAPQLGVVRVSDGVTSFTIDGMAIGLRTISDASKLLSQLLPRSYDNDIKLKGGEQLEAAVNSEVLALRQICDERLALIIRLDADLKSALENLGELQAVCDERLALIEELDLALNATGASTQ